MAGHTHDEHHSAEQKPVSFTVPFILASVTILIVVMFLSLCDPKAHHDDHHGMENPAHAKFEGQEHNPNAVEGKEEARGDHATTTTKDTSHVESATPAEAHGEQHH